MNKEIVLKVARGPKSVYNTFTAEQKAERIYFSLDTNEVLVDDVVFGIDLLSEETNLISEVVKSGNDLVFTKSNGKIVTITLPKASHTEDGLLSKEDKQFIDSIPEVYATKQEVKDYLTWKVISITLEETLANGGLTILEEDLKIPTKLTVTKNSHIDLNNHNIILEHFDANAKEAVFEVTSGTLELVGEGLVDAGTGNYTNIAVWAVGENSKVIIRGGHYKNGVDRDGNYSDLIYAADGASIEVYGGKFEGVQDKNGKVWALNLRDRTDSSIIVYGGYFVNFDPAHPNTEPDKSVSFVAEGYESVKVDGTDNDYIVQKIN